MDEKKQFNRRLDVRLLDEINRMNTEVFVAICAVTALGVWCGIIKEHMLPYVTLFWFLGLLLSIPLSMVKVLTKRE